MFVRIFVALVRDCYSEVLDLYTGSETGVVANRITLIALSGIWEGDFGLFVKPEWVSLGIMDIFGW